MTDTIDRGSEPRIVVCGSIAIDRIMSFKDSYQNIIQPDKIDVLSVSVLLDKIEVSRGGIGANIAYGLAKLGEKPFLLTSIGQDGSDYINDLGSLGIDISHVHYSDLPTASYNVITDNQHNQVSGFYEGAMTDSKTVSLRPWAGQNILAVIAGNNPQAMNRLMDECKELSMPMVYDPGQQVTADVVNHQQGLAQADVVFVNDYELSVICRKFNKSAEQIKHEVPILVTTLGSRGSIIEGNKVASPMNIPIAKGNPVDPTGAGDVYRSGFLYGYARGWALETCAKLGATTASFIIEQPGTQQSFTPDQVMERFKLNFNQVIEL